MSSPLPIRRKLTSSVDPIVRSSVWLTTVGQQKRIVSANNVFISKAKPAQEGTGEADKRGKSDPAGQNGVPHKSAAVKDNITTSDLPTTCASRFLKKHQSPFEATVVKQLRQDISTVHKTNMDEFGMGSHSTNSFFGPVSQREFVEKDFCDVSAGGSSGGSAAAIAQDLACEVALGTDTGGSVRLPAAYSKVCGFKPSYGLLSRWGVVPYANSLDTVGILARSPRRILDTFCALEKHDPEDPTSLSEATRERSLGERERERRATFERVSSNMPATLLELQRGHKSIIYSDDNQKKIFAQLRIGVPMEYNIAELSKDARLAWRRVLTLFQEQGCTVVPISLPHTKEALSAYYVLAPAEAASNLAKYDGIRYGTRSQSSDGSGDVLYSNSRGQGFGREVKRRILLGSYALSSTAIDNYFVQAQKVRRLVQQDFDRVFAMPNPLRNPQQFDLANMGDSIQLENKLGPPQVDLIICPTAPTAAPEIKYVQNPKNPLDAYINDVFTVPASLAGLPAISIPCVFKNWRKVPSVQIIGQYSDDIRVLTVAQQLQNLLRLDTLRCVVAGLRSPKRKDFSLGAWMRTKKEGLAGPSSYAPIEQPRLAPGSRSSTIRTNHLRTGKDKNMSEWEIALAETRLQKWWKV